MRRLTGPLLRACVRASVCHGNCVFFAGVAYNDRLPPPKLPPPLGRLVLKVVHVSSIERLTPLLSISLARKTFGFANYRLRISAYIAILNLTSDCTHSFSY